MSRQRPMANRSATLLALLGVAILFSSPVDAQRRRGARADRDDRRDAPAVLGAFDAIAAQAAQSSASVHVGDRAASMATVVSADGFLLSKASELAKLPVDGDDTPLALSCVLSDGRTLEAELMLVDEEFDLALLSVSARDLTPLKWSPTDAGVGRVVVSSSTDGKALAVGIVGVAAKPIRGGSGYLGVSLGNVDTGGVEVVNVLDGTPAMAAGLEPGDVLLSIDGNAVTGRDEAVAAIRARSSGARLLLALRRGEKELQLEAQLGARSSTTTPRGRRRGRGATRLEGPQSDRRTGFPSALQHDTVLAPADCGGPLLALDGSAVGLNIARAGRVSTYAIPASVLRPLIAELLTEARSLQP